MCWIGTEELQGAVMLNAVRELPTGLVTGGEGDICDEAEALGGPVMHVTAMTLQQGLGKSVHHGRFGLDHFASPLETGPFSVSNMSGLKNTTTISALQFCDL